MWKEGLRLLKPGAFLLAFGSTRTYHRMACAIEDAGFEIKDSMVWLYASGYPTHAVLRKDGDQIIRGCRFTTGPFIEPITVWDSSMGAASTAMWSS